MYNVVSHKVIIVTLGFNFRLNSTLKEDPNGRVASDELFYRYCTTTPVPVSRKKFGYVLKRVFPNITLTTVVGKINKKVVGAFKGIALKEADERNAIGLGDLVLHLPTYAILMSPCTTNSCTIGLKTGFLSNGNLVMKILKVCGSTWSLTVRGVVVDLSTLGIDSKFTMTR